MKALQYLEMMGTTQSMTQHHIPYDFCVQQHSVRNSNLAIKLHVVGIFSGSVHSKTIKCSNINTVTYYSFLLHKVQKLRMTIAWNTIYCNTVSHKPYVHNKQDTIIHIPPDLHTEEGTSSQ